MYRPSFVGTSPTAITETERLGFQLSLLNLAYQGGLQPSTIAELQQHASLGYDPVAQSSVAQA